MSKSDLLVSRVKRLGLVRLNRPKALNSLTLEMVRDFSMALDDFASDPGICAVLVTGEGERGLCAGGDIRVLFDARESNRDYCTSFWREEYELNARIAFFPKPYLVLMNGVVMGGGVGISAHGNRRVVTEKTRLAMPETGIGFIPDVGGTWLLTRNGGAGIYMALSGVAVAAADTIHVGLADVMIRSDRISELQDRLVSIREREEIDEILSNLAASPEMGDLQKNKALLDRTMGGDQLDVVIGRLAAEDSDFARQARAEILGRSPTSLRLTYELLKRAATADALQTCLVNEFRVVCRLLDTHDFCEGIRAAVIDKDRNPQWSPATLEQVDQAVIAKFMQGCGDPEPVFPPWPARYDAPLKLRS
jgi:enoyl-CoA hydratase